MSCDPSRSASSQEGAIMIEVNLTKHDALTIFTCRSLSRTATNYINLNLTVPPPASNTDPAYYDWPSVSSEFIRLNRRPSMVTNATLLNKVAFLSSCVVQARRNFFFCQFYDIFSLCSDHIDFSPFLFSLICIGTISSHPRSLCR